MVDILDKLLYNMPDLAKITLGYIPQSLIRICRVIFKNRDILEKEDYDDLVENYPDLAMKIVSRKNCKFIANSAAKCGNLEVINYFRENVRSWGHAYKESMIIAASNGQLEMMKLLSTLKIENREGGLEGAIEFGDLNIARWAIENLYRFNEQNPFDSRYYVQCAKKENIPMLELLWSVNMTGTGISMVMETASEFGNYKGLIWFHEHRFPASSQVFVNLAQRGSLKMIIWAFENRLPYNDGVLDKAVIRKYLKRENVKWFVEHNFPYNDRTRARLRALGMIS